jgi:hypothetical protein
VSLLSEAWEYLGSNDQPFVAVFDRLGFPSGVSWQTVLMFDWPKQDGQEPEIRLAGQNAPVKSQAVYGHCRTGFGRCGVQKRAALLARALWTNGCA